MRKRFFITALLVALFLASMPAAFAVVGWDSKQLTNNGRYDGPPDIKMHNGKAHVVYNEWDGEDLEIVYSTNASGWTRELITKNDTHEYDPKIAMDSNGKAHVVYVRDQEIIYATNKSGSWVRAKLTKDRLSDESPSIAVNKSNVYIAFVKNSNINYITNASGKWVKELGNINGKNPRIYVKNGKSYIFFNRYDSWYGWQVFKIDNSSGSWSNSEKWAFGKDGRAVIDGNGKWHFVYIKESTGHVFYKTNMIGSWTETKLTTNSDSWYSDKHYNPSIAIYNNKVFVTYRKDASSAASDGLYYVTNASGTFETTQLTTDAKDENPVMALSSGKAHVVYQKNINDDYTEIYYMNKQ